jgi:16S rRNA (guanine527-N7)-methyltransferase
VKIYLEFLDHLLSRMDLKASQSDLEKYLLLLDELLFWNKKVNLTAITEPEEVIEKHIIDSLTLCPFINKCGTLLDIGSGAGFPALPLKISYPDMRVLSVEASRKKVYFQRNTVRKLGLKGIQILHCRAENLKKEVPDLPDFDVIVSRAVGPARDFLKLTVPYLAESGRVIAMKGPGGEGEVDDPRDIEGFLLKKVHSLNLPISGALRKLLVFERNQAQDHLVFP